VAEGEDFSSITLPGLFVGRTSLLYVSFAGSDLARSTFNWSDFTGCDFSGCNLAGSDLRACTFRDCSFDGADLRDVDLRRSSLKSCTFKSARMAGCKLGKVGVLSGLLGGLRLAADQRAEVDWSDPGPEPEGG